MPIPQIVQPPIGLAAGVNMSVNDVNGPLSYVTGGVLVSASALGLASVKFVKAMDLSTDGLNFVRIVAIPGLGAKTFKVLWFVNATGAEVANATNLTAKIIRLLGLGL